MPSSPSPSSSVQAARQRIADRLRELRVEAELTGRELSRAAGWNPSKTSRIERGTQPASADDIRTWCQVCGAGNAASDLIAATREAEGAYVEWRRLERTGLRRLQGTYVPLFERTRHFRNYQSHVMPGMLQTAGYAAALMRLISQAHDVPDDADQAAAARVERQRLLHSDRRFAFLIEEHVLRNGHGGSEVMAGQLGRLLEALTLPSVSLGVIPADPDRAMWTLEGFTLFDSEQVHAELLTARVTITAPGELAMYEAAFERLSGMAVYGRQARALIRAAMDALE